ncbi:MAG TPA: hypothetical protein VIR57_08960 [Chloroflexota bacterium]
MNSTRYFQEQVLRKRPYISLEMCERVVASPDWRDAQTDGRIRYWSFPRELEGRSLRVVTLEDGVTIHNAFPDRRFTIERLERLKQLRGGR